MPEHPKRQARILDFSRKSKLVSLRPPEISRMVPDLSSRARAPSGHHQSSRSQNNVLSSRPPTRVLRLRTEPILHPSPHLDKYGPKQSTEPSGLTSTLGRSQTEPLTAWLRVPLSWYASHTRAFFPDETHARIRRVFDADPAGRTRRLFCGFCGTHLSAWDEEQAARGIDEVLDVTLGSLEAESLTKLQDLGFWVNEEEEEEDNEEAEMAAEGITEEGLVKGGSVTNEDHVNKDDMDHAVDVLTRRNRPAHSMLDRGLPGFEETIESSPVGRIRRRRGGHASGNGRVRIEWEIVEIEGDGDEGENDLKEDHVHKKIKMDLS
nr:hypothetical protein CFP56_07876 [Quercus suber]